VTVGHGAKALLILAATVIVLAGVKLAAPILVPFLLALFITLVSAPFALWLYDKGVPRGVAVTITFLLLVAGLTGLGALVGGSINAFYDQLPEYRVELADYAQRFRDNMRPLGDPFGAGQDDTVISSSVMEAIAMLIRSLADVVRIHEGDHGFSIGGLNKSLQRLSFL